MSENENHAMENSDDDMMDYLNKYMVLYTNRTLYNPIDKCLLPSMFRKFEQRIRDMEVYEDDTWMLSFPRSGTTWSLEMIWLLIHNLDYKGAEVDLLERVRFLEEDIFGVSLTEETPVEQSERPKLKLDRIDALPRPRIIRTHLPPELLPAQLKTKKPKVLDGQAMEGILLQQLPLRYPMSSSAIVFVLRNSTDVAISFYHLCCIFFGYLGSLENFFKAMREGLTLYGCFWHYVARLWKLHTLPNVLYLTYDEMQKDLPLVIKKTAKFLDKPISDKQVAQLADHLSFSKMRSNRAVNMELYIEKKNYGRSAPDRNFIRQGRSGEYKIVMPEETAREFDEWNCKMKQYLGLSDDKEFPL